jgi:hypothetical protein
MVTSVATWPSTSSTIEPVQAKESLWLVTTYVYVTEMPSHTSLPSAVLVTLMVQSSPLTVASTDSVTVVVSGSSRVPDAVAVLVTEPSMDPLASTVWLAPGSSVMSVATSPRRLSVRVPVQVKESLLLVTM